MTDGQSIVKNALEQLRSSISPEDDRSFADANLRDVWAVARDIENKQAARLAMRNMARLEPILRTLESYSGVIDTFCQGFSPMAFVWGPIKLMLQLGRQHKEILDKLLQALEEIADVLPVVDQMKATFGDEQDFQRTLGLIYSDLLEFLLRVYRFLRRRAWHIYFTFDWGLFERRFTSIIGTLRSHCELLGRQAAAMHYFEMRKMREVRQIADEEYERERQHKMVQEVFAWLSAAEDSQEDYLHQLSETRQLRTCDWILEHDRIYPWIENETGDAVIWMTGIPGAGKSVLCSLLIENLRIHKELATLYYFCGQRGAEDDCGTVLRTFVLQILRQNLDMAPLVHQAYYQKGSSRSKQSLTTMLRDLLSNMTNTRIVLDGIDEWDLSLQQELLRSLIELQKHSGDSCKLLVSSRQEPQIKKIMPKKTEFPLEGNTAGGLQKYIHERVKELELFFPGLDRKLINRVELRLRQMAKGMFLWVRLVITMLQQQVSEFEFEEAIERLPDGLEQAYGRILSRIKDLKSDLRERAFRVLFWLCACLRPVKMHEVADGLALRPGQTVLNRKTRFQDADRDIVEFCAPMVEKLESGVLSLVHFSAKEYLLDLQSGPFLAIAQAHFDIAFSCVTNLVSASTILPRFSGERGEMTEIDVESSVVQGSYGLQEYGHRFWAEHVREYANLAPNPDDQTNILAGALNALCVVQRGHPGHEILQDGSQQPYSGAEKLPGLDKFPALQTFVNKWLHFRSELDKAAVNIDNLDTQNQWQLQKDETYLTLVDHGLREVTERLLAMERSNLPCHIQAVDFTDFITRFGFNCRFHNCTHSFITARRRDAHEAQHTPSFPCLRCDFSGRGFRTRRDLKRHTEQYHMSMEDFEIPTHLRMAGPSSYVSQFGSSLFRGIPVRAPKCWNERGRDILRRGFEQALDKIESDMMPVNEMHEDSTLSSGDTSGTTTEINTLSKIREKVTHNRYDSLLEFKTDLHSITSSRSSEDLSENLQNLSLVVDQEVGIVMSGFPEFANLPLKTPAVPQRKDGNHMDTLETLEFVNGEAEASNPPNSHISATRVPYWSAAEKKEFPKLLEQFGMNHAKSSDYLKTKTPEEVKHHFLQLMKSGDNDLASLVEAANARWEPPWETDESDSMIEVEPTTISVLEESPNGNSNPGSQDPLQRQEVAVPGDLPTGTSGAGEHQRFRKEQSASKDRPAPTGTGNTDGAPSKRTRHKYKVYCTVCIERPLFSDHGAFNLHHKRFHSATREVYVCKDVSIDTIFFAGCPACSNMKRYLTRHNAYTHLRKNHFPRKTPSETLERWTKQLVEPNSAYKSLDSGAQVVQDQQVTIKPTSSGGPQLKRFAEVLKDLDLHQLSLGSAVAQINKSQSDVSTPDAGFVRFHNETANPWRATLLRDVSFEQVLGASATGSIQHDSSPSGNSPPELASDRRRALIRSDHLARHPYLTDYQKLICRDQADALNHVLDTEPVGTKTYDEVIKKLESLSCTLMNNLRDRRRQLTLAPQIPFSI